LCGNARRSIIGGLIGCGASTFCVCGRDFRVFGVWAVLMALCAPERQFEPKIPLFLAEQGPAHALIATISGPIPMMFMTRVRL
jgi:hypothetical protein